VGGRGWCCPQRVRKIEHRCSYPAAKVGSVYKSCTIYAMFNDRVSLLAVEGGTTVRYCGFPHPSIQQQWARRSRFHTHANCRKVWMRKLVLHERTTTAQVRSWPAFGQPLARVVLRPLVARGAATPTGTKVDGIQTAFRCHRPLSHRFHRQHQRHNSSSRRR